MPDTMVVSSPGPTVDPSRPSATERPEVCLTLCNQCVTIDKTGGEQPTPGLEYD